MKILILYASQKGSTADTAQYRRKLFRSENIKADCADAKDCQLDLSAYQAFIIGAPMHKSMWLPELNDFIKRNTAAFGDKPVWVFSPCVRILEPKGLIYARENYIPKRLISRLNIQEVKFFAGKLMQNEISHADIITLSERYDGNQLQALSGDHRDWPEIQD